MDLNKIYTIYALQVLFCFTLCSNLSSCERNSTKISTQNCISRSSCSLHDFGIVGIYSCIFFVFVFVFVCLFICLNDFFVWVVAYTFN